MTDPDLRNTQHIDYVLDTIIHILTRIVALESRVYKDREDKARQIRTAKVFLDATKPGV